MCPVQAMVRVYTLYKTGQTELRGHVSNTVQDGPRFVREIPLRARDVNVLLVRRAPRAKDRKQRVPFIADPAKLAAGLKCLEQHHAAFKSDTVGTLFGDISIN